MSDWTPLQPGLGDTETLVSLASKFDLASQYALRQSSSVSGALAARLAMWSGTAAEAWSAALEPVCAQAQRLANGADRIAAALRSYQATVDEIQRLTGLNESSYATQMENAANDGVTCTIRSSFEGSSCEANDDDLPGYDQADERAQEISAREHRAESYTHAMRSLDRAMDELVDRRKSADRRVIDSLNTAMGSDWGKKQAQFRSVGITDPAGMTDVALAHHFASLTIEWNENHGLGDDGAELDQFLDLYEHDPGMMSDYDDALGGAGAVDLIATIAQDSGYFQKDTAFQRANRVRNAIALGTTSWDLEESQKFVGSAITQVGRSRTIRNGAAVAFLFSGSTVFNGNIATPAIGQLDAIERGVHGAQVDDSYPGSPGLPTDTSTWLDDWDGKHGNKTASSDPASAIFLTLSHYPERVADFLAPTWDSNATERGARFQYWFHDRSWATSKFEAPTALILAAQNLTGGPLHGGDDPVASGRAAGILAQGLTALAGNAALTMKDGGIDQSQISESGRTAIAIALAIQTPSMMSGVLDGQTNSSGKVNNDYVAASDDEDPVLSPDVSYFQLAKWMGIGFSTSEGASHLNNVLDRVEATERQRLVSDPNQSPYSGFAKIMRLRGLAAGGDSGARINAAQIIDDRERESYEKWTSLLAKMPVGKLMQIPELLEDGLAGGESQLIRKFRPEPREKESALKRSTEEADAQNSREKFLLLSWLADFPAFKAELGAVPTGDAEAQKTWADAHWKGANQKFITVYGGSYTNKADVPNLNDVLDELKLAWGAGRDGAREPAA